MCCERDAGREWCEEHFRIAIKFAILVRNAPLVFVVSTRVCGSELGEYIKLIPDGREESLT